MSKSEDGDIVRELLDASDHPYWNGGRWVGRKTDHMLKQEAAATITALRARERALLAEANAYRAKRRAKRECSADQWRACAEAHTVAMQNTDRTLKEHTLE